MTDKEKRKLKDGIISIFKKFNILDQTATIGSLRDNILKYINSLQEVQCELDTIETKETASIWNAAHKTIPEDSSNQIICIKEDDLAVATVGKLVRGTKKWAYLNDLLNISDVKTKDANLEKELERLDSLLFDLDGIAIAGTTSYLTVEDVKDIAKRFFELGINTQKGE